MKIATVSVESKIEFKDIPPTLEAMQAEVDGYLEAMDLTADVGCPVICYFNEEGRLRELAPNFVMTFMLRSMGRIGMNDYLFGPAFFSGDNGNGGDVDLPAEFVEFLQVVDRHYQGYFDRHGVPQNWSRQPEAEEPGEGE